MRNNMAVYFNDYTYCYTSKVESVKLFWILNWLIKITRAHWIYHSCVEHTVYIALIFIVTQHNHEGYINYKRFVEIANLNIRNIES